MLYCVFIWVSRLPSSFGATPWVFLRDPFLYTWCFDYFLSCFLLPVHWRSPHNSSQFRALANCSNVSSKSSSTRCTWREKGSFFELQQNLKTPSVNFWYVSVIQKSIEFSWTLNGSFISAWFSFLNWSMILYCNCIGIENIDSLS